MYVPIATFINYLFSPTKAIAAQGLFEWLGTSGVTPPPTASDLNIFVNIVKSVAFAATGAVAISMFLFGIFKLFIAGGDEGKVTEAKKIIYASLIGLSIIITAQFLVTTFLTITY